MKPDMTDFRRRSKEGFVTGSRKGWSSTIWMLKILIPISFFTKLLAYGGWLNHLEFMLKPLMGLLKLPPEAAMPLIAGILTGIYGGIAAMLAFPLTLNQMTLIAVFLLISHNMIQEGIVQGQSGMSAVRITIIRLIASVITTMIVGLFLGSEPAMTSARSAVASASQEFMPMLADWSVAMSYLCLKIVVIVMSLMIFLGMLKSFDLIPFIVRMLSPFLKIMGVRERVGILWLTGAVFGIAYGSAVIIEEAREGDFDEEELTELHISLGINHAIVEDPSLFVAIGLGAFWVWIPRLVTAVVFVHLYRLWLRVKFGAESVMPAKEVDMLCPIPSSSQKEIRHVR